jgi:glycosyltransferase involved in cell wall biosynthesis
MSRKIKNLGPKIWTKLNPADRPSIGKTIAVCAAQVPFFKGGAEAHVAGLVRELKNRGYEVELINIPYKWYPHEQLLKSIDIWRMLDLHESNGKKIDLVITTKFPSYFAQHSNKVLWLIHQYRQVYDLFETPYSGFDPSKPKDRERRKALIEMDNRVLRSYKRIYTNSANTASRLKKYNNIDSTPLYHPPHLEGRYHSTDFEDYILSVGRLDSLKRVDLLIKSLPSCLPKLKCKIVGTGPESNRLQSLARELGVSEKVEFLGFVEDDDLLDLYARCSAVFFCPLDEDYGYITLEAFLSRKPVITCFDAGGPLEFVQDGVNGIVLDTLEEKEIGKRMGELLLDREKCAQLGLEGYRRVKGIQWDQVIQTLLYG